MSPEERRRYQAWVTARVVRFDNLHYQHEHGFLDDEYYESTFKTLIRNLAPHWEEVGSLQRPSFLAEVERILSESEAESEENEQ